MPKPALAVVKPFQLSVVDREAFHPDHPAIDDITWWQQLYFPHLRIFDWQHYFYHYPCKDKMVVAGIRVGKSMGATLGMLHHAQFHPYCRILNTSISSEQAKIVYYNMMDLIQQERFKHWIETTEKSPYPRIQLVNGAEIWFRSLGYEAELLRGFEFDLIHLDEGAYVQSEMSIKTLRGRLLGVNPKTGRPRAGIFWTSTTPKGKAGWVYERWKRGDPRFEGADTNRYLSLRVRTVENPLLSKDILREIMADYTERMIQQELEGEFLDDTAAEFNLAEIQACCDPSDPMVAHLLLRIQQQRERQGKRQSLRLELGLSEDLDHFELEPEMGHQYLASWDLGKRATKEGRNATVGMVWDITKLPWTMVAYRHELGTGYVPAMGMIEQWHTKYSSMGTRCLTSIDASGKGDVLNELIEEENRFSVDGIVYNAVLKPNLITAAKVAIERGLVRFPFVKRFVDQLQLYTQNDKDIPQDTVMAFAQSMYKAREFTGVGRYTPPATNTHVLQRFGQNHPQARRTSERRRESMRRRTNRRVM